MTITVKSPIENPAEVVSKHVASVTKDQPQCECRCDNYESAKTSAIDRNVSGFKGFVRRLFTASIYSLDPAAIIMKLNDFDYRVRYNAVDEIKYIPETDIRTMLIENALKDEYGAVCELAVSQIQYAGYRDVTRLINMLLNDPRDTMRSAVTEQIKYALYEDRTMLIRTALNDHEQFVRAYVLEQIVYVPPDDVAGLIKIALNDKSTQVRATAVTQIQYAREEERPGLIYIALHDMDEYVLKKAIDAINYLPKDQQANVRRAIGIFLESDKNEIDYGAPVF